MSFTDDQIKQLRKELFRLTSKYADLSLVYTRRVFREPRAQMPPNDVTTRQTARGLLRHAEEYMIAAKAIRVFSGNDPTLDALGNRDVHNPFYFLCGHSLELSMKGTDRLTPSSLRVCQTSERTYHYRGKSSHGKSRIKEIRKA